MTNNTLKSMKTVVILSSGLGSRLNPITEVIPKVMVNYQNYTVLKHLYNLYSNLKADRIIVVVHSKFKDLVLSYCAYEDILVEVRTVDEVLGSAHAISTLELSGNVVFNWSDVIPTFEKFTWDSDVIYTHGASSRYLFMDGELSQYEYGNVVGVYQAKDFDEIKKRLEFTGLRLDPSIDFIDFLPVEKFQQGKLKSVIDIGDFDKMDLAHQSAKTVSREFNSVKLDACNKLVTKTALNDKGIQLQKREATWYLVADNYNNIPGLLQYDKRNGVLTTEYISGTLLFRHVAMSNPRNMVKRVLTTSIFSPDKLYPSSATIRGDYYQEVVRKTLDRCNLIQPVVESVPHHIRSVNGVVIDKDILGLSNFVFNYLMSNCDISESPYTVIHGDLNFSNILLEHKTDTLKYIDPRGYFGNTELYGPRFYDEAKVLYALSGYDMFNADALWRNFSINGDELYINIEPLCDLDEVSDMFTDYHRLMVAIIWLNLAGYFKNNPLKAFIAYYFGLYLLTTEVNKVKNKCLNEELAVVSKT